jgi:hypothetical protein
MPKITGVKPVNFHGRASYVALHLSRGVDACALPPFTEFIAPACGAPGIRAGPARLGNPTR